MKKRNFLGTIVIGTITIGALLLFLIQNIGGAILSFVTFQFLKKWWEKKSTKDQ